MKSGISVAEASAIAREATRIVAPESVAAPASLGRVLAVDIHSDRTLPPADCSAMDGYALRAADAASGRPLPVVYEVAAGGQASRSLAAGEAARIFTGAPVPPGADCVVRQEDTQARDGEVEIQITPARGDHIRLAGEDVREGDVVLDAGTSIGPAQIGMLVSLGRTIARVHARPRVAVLSGGDELVEPDEDASGGRIVSSNGYSLVAQCQDAGAEARNLCIARDTPEALEALLRAGLSSDVIVSSAGVSVGDHDHVRPVLEKLGCELVFWGVKMKPGYPIVFGRVGESGPLVFGLPGNPVSAMVTFELFVRPTLLKMAGHTRLFRPRVEAKLSEGLEKKAGRAHYVRVHLERSDAGLLARPTGNQSSGVLRSMTKAQGLLHFPAEAERLEAGARASVQILDRGFGDETDPPA